MGYSLKVVKALRFCRTKWKPRKGRDFLFPSFLTQKVSFKPNVKRKHVPLFGAHIVHMKQYGLNTYEHAATLCCNTVRRD